MPTHFDTDAGYFLHCEPVHHFDAFNLQKLTMLLEGALSKPNPMTKASHMPPEELVMGPYLNVKSQDELEKKTIYVSVKRLDTGFRIASLNKLPNGLQDRKGQKALDITISLDTTYEQLAARIIEHLKSRKDLPSSEVTALR